MMMLTEQYGVGECLKMLDNLAVRTRSKQVGNSPHKGCVYERERAGRGSHTYCPNEYREEI